MPNRDLSSLITPRLLLDRAKMRFNLTRMADHIHALGCVLRPHVKTHKSRDVLNEVKALSGNSGITVSTLHEARYFHEHGERDILYAVGIAPGKVVEAAALIDEGCSLTVIADNLATVLAVDETAKQCKINLPMLVELDVDGHRSGVDPLGNELLDLARFISTAGNLQFRGVMAHAGGSYDCGNLEAISRHAEKERALTVEAAQRLRACGIEPSVVSIGSTPTAIMTNDLTGITEIRPGVYTFFDLFQVGLGVAQLGDVALSVLTTVIGHRPDKGWVIVDAGWMAMSRDRGTQSQAVDQGYGLICEIDGTPLEHVIVGQANQEHGVLMPRRSHEKLDIRRFPIGSKWRILPNHACATAAQHHAYDVVEKGEIIAHWPRTQGW